MRRNLSGARLVLWLKANTTAEINLVVKLLSRLSKLELTAFAVERPLPQVPETQVLWFTLTLSKLSLQGVATTPENHADY